MTFCAGAGFELLGEPRLIFETAQIENNAPGIDAADNRNR
jgi:hypothetical protein